MDNKKNIIWLASYPKSGNTWFRSFLTALVTKNDIDLNKMEFVGIFSGKHYIENALDVSADYLRPEQIESYQKLAFSHLSDTTQKPLFIKIHDAFTFSEKDKLPLIPEKPTKIALCFIRNPLDVTLSLANHMGDDVETTIEKFIINPKGAFIKKRNNASNQFHQPLGTWSNHVESWKNCPTFPVHFMRYEDMKNKPFETFKAAVMAIGLDYSDNDIQQAIEAVEFEKLQKKERDKGFKENQNLASSFFFKGQVGRWKTELTAEQIEKIRTVNEPMMREFGYWE
jgi:Sulfotransferase domain